MTATQPSTSDTPLEHVPSSSHETSIHGPALTGWQSHQSHGQLTIVFYVDLDVRSEDIEVIIASTYVIAGIRGYEPVVKARLYARIDPTTSYWQLERPAHQHRSRTRSRTTSGGGQSSSGHEAGPSNDRRGTSGQQSRASISQRRASRHDNASGDGSGSGSNDSAPSPEQHRHSSRPASPVPSTGSYELLQRSIASLNTSSSSRDASGSGNSSSEGYPFHRAADAERGDETGRASLISPPSHTSLRSYGGDSNEQFGVASLQSSQVLGSATSVSQQSSGDANHELTARLLTVHLTKIDGALCKAL
ncbi:hypothetical protein BCV69DRAFT_80424 [Microstroma glucosiphilum]|uniref:CS domain-containing protein n=1 Tax=Pseudomicrostroma glucosiphilum TaxID=1684307 RepID=A0A316TY91_9BASI|nr:hypothetical protein BCV69DRAFT_80424 [Pseudomicrostroma glucosiphilum]PWN18279.1 hypothetical protein BCV69DRAFT_80424 [Pseudomicrostroma glucosiphilum]